MLLPASATTVTVWHALTSLGLFTLCMAAAVFFLCAVPTLLAFRRAAARLEAVLSVVESELPPAAATVRLNGLELSDCLSELNGLGSDVTSGVRACSRMLSQTEQSIRQVPKVVNMTVNGHIKPVLAQGEATARGKLEDALVQRAQLDYTPFLRGVSSAVRRVRIALAAIAYITASASVTGAMVSTGAT